MQGDVAESVSRQKLVLHAWTETRTHESELITRHQSSSPTALVPFVWSCKFQLRCGHISVPCHLQGFGDAPLERPRCYYQRNSRFITVPGWYKF